MINNNMMNSQYMFDYPAINIDVRCHRLLSSVSYVAHNKFHTHDVSTYEHCEIPLEKLRLGFGRRSSLSDFYSLGELPASWGPACYISSVKPMVYTFQGMASDLSRFDLTSFSRRGLPNVLKALSWPLGIPDCEIFSICSDRFVRGLQTRDQLMSYILRMGDSHSLDECIVQAHKKILQEARRLGLSDEHYNGYDLFREIGSLVCLRLINAEPFDTAFSGEALDIRTVIRSYRASDPSASLTEYGNSLWTPIHSHVDENDESSSDSDF
ncbi:nonstructural protein [sandfly fever Turkey virus]|uniref:Non-structural protein NS-S n=1 Tax=Sandfly fever sicilian virus TaxID=28292 RepID=D9YRN0_SFSV|nr:nonstructural protein [Sandfly fever Turkey virus]ACZ55878.2 nonstructural protein [Sandfly fever Turkey virus]